MFYQLRNLNTTHIREEFTCNSSTIYILTNGIMIRRLSDFSPWIFIFWLIFFCFRCVLSVFLSVIVSLHWLSAGSHKVHIIQMLILGGGSIQGTTLSHWPSSKAIYCHFSLKILGTILDQWPLPWLTSTSNIYCGWVSVIVRVSWMVGHMVNDIFTIFLGSMWCFNTNKHNITKT